jgi:hypothetical protein
VGDIYRGDLAVAKYPFTLKCLHVTNCRIESLTWMDPLTLVLSVVLY